MRRLLITAILIALIITSTGCRPQEYEVNIEIAPEGSGEVVGEGTYEAGEEVDLAALPNEEYKFTNWNVDGEVISKDNIHKMTINEDLNLTANFDRIRRNKFAYVNINDGVDVRIGPFYEGEEISLKAETTEGYEFSNWEIDGEKFSEEKKIEFNIDKKDIKVKANYENLAKEVNKIIEEADKALGEKRWIRAGEFLLAAVESDQIRHSKYNENIEEFFSIFARSKEDIIQALINEEITTKEDIENVNWEKIVPEEPKLDILEREDEEIYEWFYKYFEFYGRIHSGSGIKNIRESIWSLDNPLTSEGAYNDVQKVVLQYSENTVGEFLMANRKLIDNGIFAYQIGGADGPFIYDVFTMDDSKFLGLDKEENKLIFEFEYTLETDRPEVRTNSDGKFKIEVEIHEKKDGTFRVGDYGYTNDFDKYIIKADKALKEKRWKEAGEYLQKAKDEKRGIIQHSNKNYEMFYADSFSSREELYDTIKNERIVTLNDVKDINWNSIEPDNPEIEIFEKEDKEVYEWFKNYMRLYEDIRLGKIFENNLDNTKNFNVISEEAYNYIQNIVFKYSENSVDIYSFEQIKLIDSSLYMSDGKKGNFTTDQKVFMESEFVSLERTDTYIIFKLKNVKFDNLRQSGSKEIEINDNFNVKIEIHEKEDDTFRVGETSFIFE